MRYKMVNTEAWFPVLRFAEVGIFQWPCHQIRKTSDRNQCCTVVMHSLLTKGRLVQRAEINMERCLRDGHRCCLECVLPCDEERCSCHAPINVSLPRGRTSNLLLLTLRACLSSVISNSDVRRDLSLEKYLRDMSRSLSVLKS